MTHPVDPSTGAPVAAPAPMAQTAPAPMSAPAAPTRDPGAFDRLLARRTANAGDGAGETAEQRAIEIVMGLACWEPGAFDEPVTLLIRCLSSREIEKHMGKGKVDTFLFDMCRAAIVSVNGRKIMGEERTILWDALSFTGLTALTDAFSSHALGMDAAALEKARASVSVR